MMMLNPVISILYNREEDKYHPIVFVEKPFPGGMEDGDAPRRFKSKMHHTSGFNSREEAVESARGELTEQIKEKSGGVSIYYDLEKVIHWNGEGIPAMVEFFDTSNMESA